MQYLNKIIVSLSLLATLSAYASDETSKDVQEIRVYLPTTNSLEPLYLGKVLKSGEGIDAKYINLLEEILTYDFNYNGSTKVMPRAKEKESALEQNNFNPMTWRNFGATHVVQAKIENKILSLTVFSSETGSLKQFEGIALTGTIGKDRHQLHLAADAVYKALFGIDGIASTRILYSVKQKPSYGREWISEIWSCDWDGANPKQITKEGSYSVTPVFIPPHSKFANDRFLYVSYKTGQPKIFLASLKDGVGKRLIDLKGHQMLPAISPKRDKIAFISDAGGSVDLFLQEFHPETGDVGKPVQLFSYPKATQASPTFSPDGSRLAFVSDKDGSPRIYIIPARFQGKRATPILISKQNQENSCPAWSPDGKKLAYSAKTNGVRQIWIYDLETKEEKQLTEGPRIKENPSWATDSTHIVFDATDGNSSDLYIVNLNQPEAIKISQGPGVKHYPTWGNH
jgi:TolB protein